VTDDANPDDVSLDEVVRRFVDAETALIDLRQHQTSLLDATQRFIATDAQLTDRTAGALAALEDARARLREQMESGAEIVQSTTELHASFAGTTTEVGLVLQTLRQIDPARMVRDLDELRRAGADNAAELREVRRLIVDLERIHGDLAAQHAKLTDAHADSLKRLKLLVPLSIVTLVVAVASVAVGLIR